MEENANKLQFKCTDFNSSMCVAVCAECIYVLTEYLKYLSIRRHSYFLQCSTVRSAAAWPPVNCACVPQFLRAY